MEPKTLKCLFLTFLCCEFLISWNQVDASINVLPITPTYTVAATPGIITGHSHQVITRNYNRFYVPATTVYPVTAYGTYPFVGYPSYGYDYGYGYGGYGYYGYYR